MRVDHTDHQGERPLLFKMSNKNKPSGPKNTISHYFSASPAKVVEPPTTTETLGKRKRESQVVDLTLESDDDEGQPATKRQNASNQFTRPAGAIPSRPKDSESPLKKRFRYIAPDEEDSSPPPVQDLQTRARNEARRKQLKETLKQIQRSSSAGAEDEFDEDQQTQTTGSEQDEENGGLTSQLRKKFSSNLALSRQESKKSTGKGKRKGEEIGPSGQPYTPLELQVKQLKEENPGTLLLFEVGYKYRFFGEDARIASKALGIACFMDRNFLTGSIPVYRKMIHTKKLLSLGHRVGIVGQTETAALKKAGDNRSGPFRRQVTELYTATTFVDEMESLDENDLFNTGAALLCLAESLMGGMGPDDRVGFGLVSVIPSTGEVVYDQFSDVAMRTELETRLAHIKPCELLLPATGLSSHTEKMLKHYAGSGSARIERIEDALHYTDAFEYLREFYQDVEATQTTEALSATFQENQPFNDVLDLPKPVVVALAHAVRHLRAYGLSNAFRKTTFFCPFMTRSHMLLNANTLTNLEIFQNQTDYSRKGSLIWRVDHTKTKFGSRLLRQWISKPLVNKRLLEERFQAVEDILNTQSAALVKLRTVLKGLPDLTKGLSRIQYGKSTPKEVATVLTALQRVANEFDLIDKPQDAGLKSPLLNDILFTLPRLREPVQQFLNDINVTKAHEGELTDLWRDSEKYPEVDDAKMLILSIELHMQDHLKEVRKILKRPTLNWVSVSGVDFLVEVPNSEKSKVPENWNRVQGTKKVTRFHTPEARQRISEREQLKETLQAVSVKAFEKFQAEINAEYGLLRDAVNKLAVADALASLALVATEDGYTKPQIVEDDELEIVKGRHPLIEAISSAPFVPNDIALGRRTNLAMVITGPNMGGKSSCTRLTALLVIMAQSGCWVPAEHARIPLHDAVLTRMGASDEIQRGRSTFMVEMSETAEIIQSATERSLVILDELGRGTATWDGVAIATAVLDHMVSVIRCKTLFITHYPQIGVELSQKYPGLVANAHMGYLEEELADGRREIHFLYRLQDGVADKSFGVECGRLAGLPEVVLAQASRKSAEWEERERSLHLRSTLKDIARVSTSSSMHQAISLQKLKVTIGKMIARR